MNQRKTFWEKILIFPSYENRFVFIIIILIIIGISLIIYFFKTKSISIFLTITNLIIQGLMLIIGIISVYLILKQLIEARLDKLKESAYQFLKLKHYPKAIELYKECLYIKPDFMFFSNLIELYLIIGNFKEFDNIIESYEKSKTIKKLIIDDRDKLIYLYLRSVRHLLVENIGDAKSYIKSIVNFVKERKINLKIEYLMWDFSDLKSSSVYMELKGEARIVLDNLIEYLHGNMDDEKKKLFEEGNYNISSN